VPARPASCRWPATVTRLVRAECRAVVAVTGHLLRLPGQLDGGSRTRSPSRVPASLLPGGSSTTSTDRGSFGSSGRGDRPTSVQAWCGRKAAHPWIRSHGLPRMSSSRERPRTVQGKSDRVRLGGGNVALVGDNMVVAVQG
jgi:hypothetical protein